jgi:hypothetical protein
VLGPIAYPWGFPLLLAPFYTIFGLNFITLKAVGVLSYVLFLALFWVGFRRVHSPFWFLCLVCLFALNPTLLAFANNILSDFPFLFLSTLSLVLIGLVVVERRRLISEYWDSVLIGLVIAAACFVRTNGFLLLITLEITQLISYVAGQLPECHLKTKNAWRLISLRPLLMPGNVSAQRLFNYFIPYIVFTCSVVIWELFLPQGGASHLSQLRDLSMGIIMKKLVNNLYLPSKFFSGIPFHYLIFVASIPLAIAGVLRRVCSDYHTVIYAVLTLALYTFWPSQQGLRFLFPILPFYLSFVLSGLEAFQGSAKAAKMKLQKWFFYVPVLLMILYFGFLSTRNVFQNINQDCEMSSGSLTLNSMSMYSFIMENTSEESTIIFFKPRMMKLMTDRQSIMINTVEELSRGDILCLFLQGNTNNQVSTDTVDTLLRQGAANLIYENSDFKVYRLDQKRLE